MISFTVIVRCLAVVVYSYAESASHLLYQIYCELVLPIPPVLEHLRSPDSNENERSVPLPSVTDVMLYQSSSADFGQSQTDRDRPRYVILCFCAFSIEHTHTPVSRPFFRDYPGEPVPER